MIRAFKTPREPRSPDTSYGILTRDQTEAIVAGQVRLLYTQSSSAFTAVALIACVVAQVFWELAHPAVVGVWLAVALGLTLARTGLVRSYRQLSPDAEAPVWARRFLWGIVLSGCVWGLAGVLFFIPESPIHQLFLAFVLAGLAAGAMSTLSSYRGAYLAYLLPSLAPFTVQIMRQGGQLQLAMGLLLMLFAAMMLVISRRIHETLTNSLRLRFDNGDLVRELIASRDTQEAVNRELTIQIGERERAEASLKAAHNALEQRVRERTRELDASNRSLTREKELFRVTMESIGDALIATDEAGNIRFVNPVAEQVTGWPAELIVGRPLAEALRIVDEESRSPVPALLSAPGKLPSRTLGAKPCLLTCRNGREIPIEFTLSPIRDGNDSSIGTVLVFRDVSAQRKLARELNYQATHDELTGLVNRREFERRLSRVLEAAAPGDPHALLYLDLDQFKVVNDQCGHTAGDELLRQIAVQLQSRIRTRDTLARLGGDEFGVLLEHCPLEEAERVAQGVREAVQNFRFAWEDKSFAIAVTIGLLPINVPGMSLAAALGAADAACYAAKEGGRNRVHVYQPDDQDLLKRHGDMRWLPRIQSALAGGHFRLFLQPILPLQPGSGDDECAEVLLRLCDGEGRHILPGAFLPAAERYNQVVSIDRWVLDEVLSYMETTPAQRGRRYTINLSAQALPDNNFLDFAVERIHRSQVTPSALCFEINENAAIADLRRVRQFIAVLKELGCCFALDDFGAGFSSFGYLKSLDVDFLKIDGRLVRGMRENPVDQAMVESIHRIGHVMGLKTIAEWVETRELAQDLEAMGIEYGQGYFWGVPRPLVSRPVSA
jgi:diguanylate cyclase (GGDEF)-like protein/PAS domain S-box-containing protein